MAESGYYDILLVGKTGSGKSTTGNKLLTRDESEHSIRTSETVTRWYNKALHFLKGPPENEPYDKKAFVTAKDLPVEQRFKSVTAWCEVLASEVNKVRILDVPGFSDSGTLSKESQTKVNVYEGNLQVFRWIVRVQAALKITINRVVYFLPTRGALEIADGVFQDELKVMHYFFGDSIFENMVVVATNHERKQKFGFDNDDRRDTQKVLHEALKFVTKNEHIFCPPIVYIALADKGSDILKSLKSANVKSTKGIVELKFQENVCSKCSVFTRYTTPHGSKLKSVPLDVVDGCGTTIKYEDSMCHTKFVQKYTTAQKFWGGMGHVATLGIALAFKGHWPGFTNADEVCENCKLGPGSKGCCRVGDRSLLDHSNLL